MRRILIDSVERRKTKKQGGDRRRVTLDDAHLGDAAPLRELIARDHASERLAAPDERPVCVVERRFFGELTIDETAEALGISPATVSRDGHMARAWLNRMLTEDEAALKD